MFQDLDQIEYECRSCNNQITTDVFEVKEDEEAVLAFFDCPNCDDKFESYMPKEYFSDD